MMTGWMKEMAELMMIEGRKALEILVTVTSAF